MAQRDLTSKEAARLAPTVLVESEWAPCRYNCPVHADVRAYIELASRGQWTAALDLVHEALPFASICGRICHHPCEANCRRNDVDQPVAVREIKRFLAERQGERDATVHKAPSQDKAKVAIMGGGPAGMSAALELAKMGYRPTVFERFPIAGGIPATAIPRYRLPLDVVQMDIDWICRHGVELVTGVEIGKDKTIEQLRAEGFAAVLVAGGLAKSRALPMPGGDHRRVYGVLDFLQGINFGKPPEIGRDVLVIGGGNVAIDAARSALRLGAKRVRMICLEDEKEMPAWSWEQTEAREEGIEIIYRRGPVEVVAANGEITSLKSRKVTRVFDENRRFSPQYDDSDILNIECDTVVVAIGQMVDNGFAAGSGLQIDQRGRLAYDPATHQTSSADIFACGEIVTSPGSAVEACASGKRAAKAMDMFLSGRKIEIAELLPPAIDKIDKQTADKVAKTLRVKVPAAGPDARKCCFDDFEQTLAEEAVLEESRRCMSCGSGAEVLVDKCAACLTCLRVCPFDIPRVTDVARIDSALCQACGMCIADCPANAIIAKGWDVKELAAKTAKVLASMNGGKKIVAYVSGHHAPAAAWSATSEDLVPGVAEIYLPSMSRLSATELMQAFVNGADAVFVVAGAIGADRYPTATQRIRKRVELAAAMLNEIGFDSKRLVLVEVADQGRAAIRAALEKAAGEVGV